MVDGHQPSEVTVEWNGETRSVISLHLPGEWTAAPDVGLDQGADLVLMRLAVPFDFAGSTRIASGTLDDRFAVLLGTGRGGNGVLGAFEAPKARAATNTIDRQLETSGGGGLLVTDFDSGIAAHNSLDALSASMRYYDDGFGNPLPSDGLFAPTDLASGAGGVDGALLQEWFPGLPAHWLEGTTAAGDSGGPLFVFDDASGEWVLAGLTSWGFNPTLPEGFSRHDSRYGDVAFFTDLTRHADWIATTVPEPGTVALALWSAMAWLRRRRAAS